MAFFPLLSQRTPRWRDAPEPPARVAAGSAEANSSRGGRRRRLLLRGTPVVFVVAVVGIATAWATGPTTMGPSEVARTAHEQVLRDVVRRTGDFSMVIGPLDCVEIQPGRGSCLADARSRSHRADQLMVAVGYVIDPGTGQLELMVKLP